MMRILRWGGMVWEIDSVKSYNDYAL